MKINMSNKIQYEIGDVIMVEHELQNVVLVRVTNITEDNIFTGDPILKHRTVKEPFDFTLNDIFRFTNLEGD